jgi:hypothetical protein
VHVHVHVHVRPGQRWKALSEAEKAKYKTGLTYLAASGQGGVRTWVPTSALSLLPAPTTTAVAMIQSNERRASDSHFTTMPVPPRQPAVPFGAPSALPSGVSQ